MLVILTNSQDATASFLIPSIQKNGIPFARLDTDSLLQRIALKYRPASPALRIDGAWHDSSEVTHIWYRRPEPLKDQQFDETPEGKYASSEWTEFIENFFAHVPRQKWINHPSCNAAASRKLEQLTSAQAIGLKIPDTIATQEPADLREFYDLHHGCIIAKPVSTGYIERPAEQADSLIYTNRVRAEDLSDLDDLTACPTLFQQFINKAYDVRITALDADFHSVALNAKDKAGAQRCDIRRNNMSDVAYSAIELPKHVELGLCRLMANYGLRFAAIDMAVATTGEWYFLEINPNGQWAWLDESAGTNIAGSFLRVFSNRSAKKPRNA